MIKIIFRVQSLFVSISCQVWGHRLVIPALWRLGQKAGVSAVPTWAT